MWFSEDKVLVHLIRHDLTHKRLQIRLPVKIHLHFLLLPMQKVGDIRSVARGVLAHRKFFTHTSDHQLFKGRLDTYIRSVQVLEQVIEIPVE